MTRIHSSLSLAPAQVDLGLYAQAEPVYQTVPCFTLFTLLQTLVSFLIFAYGIYVLNSFSSLSFCSLILIPSPHPLGTNLQTKKFGIWFWEFSKPLKLIHWPTIRNLCLSGALCLLVSSRVFLPQQFWKRRGRGEGENSIHPSWPLC